MHLRLSCKAQLARQGYRLVLKGVLIYGVGPGAVNAGGVNSRVAYTTAGPHEC